MGDKTQQPIDNMGNAVPVLGLADDGAHSIVVAGAAARNLMPFKSSVVSIYLTADMNIRFGDDSSVATINSNRLPANTWIDLSTKGHKYISVFGTGTAYISERE